MAPRHWVVTYTNVILAILSVCEKPAIKRAFQLVDKVDKLPERAKKAKIKALKNAANKAYLSTLTERHFLNNADIRLF